jgi:hypothetical protein
MLFLNVDVVVCKKTSPVQKQGLFDGSVVFQPVTQLLISCFPLRADLLLFCKLAILLLSSWLIPSPACCTDV